MEKQITGLPGYPIAEYLLVLHPHEDLWNKIMQVKESFAKEYDCPLAPLLKPHLTLLKFTQYEMMEPRILQRLRSIAAQQHPFKVELRNFGSFPSHTIYINVTSKLPIVEMVKALRNAQRLMKLDNDNKPHFITSPHISVARKLTPWQYEKGWQEFSQRSFTGRFIANDLLLLKRRLGNKHYYQSVEKFILGGQPAPVTAGTQGELFA